MSEDFDKSITKAIMGNALTDEEVGAGVHNAFTFLASCVAGEVAEIKVGERVQAANALLQFAVRRTDLLTDIANTLGMASGEDLAVVAAVLE